MSVINGIHDPLGLVTPVTTRVKVAFRNLFKCDPALDWDDPIPSADQEMWYKLIEMLGKSKSILFPRATRPHHVFGKSQMGYFFEGSDVAYASVIYVRWTFDNGSVVIRRMSCKSRVTPLQRISTPRSELNGAVLASLFFFFLYIFLSQVQNIPERIIQISTTGLRSQDNTHKHLTFGRKIIFLTVLYRSPSFDHASPEFRIFLSNFKILFSII